MKFLGLILFLLVIGGCSVQQKSNVAANGSSNSSAGNSSASANKNPENTAELPKPEPAQLTPVQKAIADKATEAKWEEQDISWRLPSGWTKVSGDAPDRTL